MAASKKAANKNNLATKILQHPDKEEILSKLLMGFSACDIAEWLSAKYAEDTEKDFVLSEKTISTFQKDYLDIYSAIKEDLEKTHSNKLAPQDELKLEIQGSSSYHKALEKYIDSEVDIKTTVRKLVANAELRVSQMFDIIQEDPRNFKADRTLLEWFSTLANILEKYDNILNGSPDQINIQNNINIQVVDEHINVVYNVIREILSKLDYDTSLLFIELFNEEMKKIKSPKDTAILPVDVRLAEAKSLEAKLIE
jgi:hypothetical protein